MFDSILVTLLIIWQTVFTIKVAVVIWEFKERNDILHGMSRAFLWPWFFYKQMKK